MYKEKKKNWTTSECTLADAYFEQRLQLVQIAQNPEDFNYLENSDKILVSFNFVVFWTSQMRVLILIL